jgi:hypothetical protein
MTVRTKTVIALRLTTVALAALIEGEDRQRWMRQ